MGADLIIAALATTDFENLDWEAGEQVARTMDLTTLMETEFVDQLVDGELTDEQDVRDHISVAIENLKNSINQGWRDLSIFDFGEWTIIIAGGTSWGDTPGDTFDAIVTLSPAREVLDAIGFDWPEA